MNNNYNYEQYCPKPNEEAHYKPIVEKIRPVVHSCIPLADKMITNKCGVEEYFEGYNELLLAFHQIPSVDDEFLRWFTLEDPILYARWLQIITTISIINNTLENISSADDSEAPAEFLA